jgi:hypothetical protein
LFLGSYYRIEQPLVFGETPDQLQNNGDIRFRRFLNSRHLSNVTCPARCR